MEINLPYVLEDNNDFAVVYKPPKMHCVPNKGRSNDTLLEWYGKGELMHRLDFETHGLVLFTKNKKSFEFFRSLQECGEFVKEYSAVCVKTDKPVQAFGFPSFLFQRDAEPSPDKPLVIESFFRPFGHGRKQVRPVINDGKTHKEIAKDRGTYYRTEITSIINDFFTVRIRRGFRHQIRCHLSWAGYPILNDPIYSYLGKENSFSVAGILALRAQALIFRDPSNGAYIECRISPLENAPYNGENILWELKK
ncbi:MAG: RNA pseudouridine synthase [Treponema sp.]|jgi:23S rRNA pseudouridine1911/1915/1917 synthase|nr:RNA pseudouridine synthase [Treponema sp.]